MLAMILLMLSFCYHILLLFSLAVLVVTVLLLLFSILESMLVEIIDDVRFNVAAFFLLMMQVLMLIGDVRIARAVKIVSAMTYSEVLF